MKRKLILIIAAVIVLAAGIAAAVLLTGGDGGKAAAMWLVKAEGTVAVTDGEGEDVPVQSMAGMELRLGLYDGYAVGTGRASYGWINLDDTKLTKLDQDSSVTISRDGRALELSVDRGSLFFNVTRPLEEDETLEIRSSSMVMAIRGTCGWVRAVDAETFEVYIIEGTVRCTANADGAILPATKQVTAGQTARMSVKNGEPTITVGTFGESDVPDFVLAEAGADPDLSEKLAALGVTGGGTSSGGPEGPDGPGGSVEEIDWDTRDDDDDGLNGAHGDITWTIRTQRPDLTHEARYIYYELAVFEGPEAGIAAINDFLKTVADGFLNSKCPPGYDEDLDRLYGSGAVSLNIRKDVAVDFPLENIVCVSVYPNIQNPDPLNEYDIIPQYFVFDLTTGERLTIRQFADGTDQEICDAVIAAVRQTQYGAEFQPSYFSPVWLEDLSFCPRSDSILVEPLFSSVGLGDKYGRGSFQVEIPLGQRWQNGGASGGETALSGSSGGIQWEIRTLRPEGITHRVERLYYQIPVLTGPYAGIEAVNRYFRQLADGHLSLYTADYDAYFGRTYDDQRQLDDSYVDSYDTRVDFPMEGVLCVSVHHEDKNLQFDLDVFPDTYYTFDLTTGERLKLSEAADGGVSGIRAAIREKLRDTAFAAAREDVLAALPVDTLDFYIKKGVAVAVIHNHQVTLESDTEHVEVELPLSSRWQADWGAGGPAPELGDFFTGEPVEPTADEASKLQAEIRRVIADSVPSTDGSTVPTGRARLFSMDGNLAALVVCGKYDAGADAFVRPVQTYLVYMSGGEARSTLIGANRKSAWIYGGEVYVERSTAWEYMYINASGALTTADTLTLPDTEVGFRRENGGDTVTCVGLMETDGLFAALEGYIG